MVELLKHLVNNLGYVIVIAFFISKLNTFRQMIQKDQIKRIEIFILAVVFGGIGIIGTYVGIVGGLLAGLHRILIDIGGITAFPCALATVIRGFLSGVIYKKSNVKNRWLYGLGGGILVENIRMPLGTVLFDIECHWGRFFSTCFLVLFLEMTVCH